MATGRIGSTPVLRVRWSDQPAAGTTVLSGLDDNSVALVYDAGYEAVYRNGALLSRGNDYTATDGTTVTLLSATLAGDIIEIFANDLVPLTDAISKGQYNAKGALLSASAASTPGVLAVGANDTVLTADSSTSTGLKWATPAAGGMTLLSTTTLTGSSVTIGSIPATYNDLQLIITAFTPPSQHYQAIDLYTGSNSSVGGYILYDIDSISTTSVITSGSGKFYTSRPQAPGWNSTNATSHTVVNVYDYARTGVKHIIHSVTGYTDGNGTNRTALAFGCSENTGAINAINISTGLSGSFTGTAYLYGVK